MALLASASLIRVERGKQEGRELLQQIPVILTFFYHCGVYLIADHILWVY